MVVFDRDNRALEIPAWNAKKSPNVWHQSQGCLQEPQTSLLSGSEGPTSITIPRLCREAHCPQEPQNSPLTGSVLSARILRTLSLATVDHAVCRSRRPHCSLANVYRSLFMVSVLQPAHTCSRCCPPKHWRRGFLSSMFCHRNQLGSAIAWWAYGDPSFMALTFPVSESTVDWMLYHSKVYHPESWFAVYIYHARLAWFA